MQSIPAKRAIDKDCDRVVIVLTRENGAEPTDYAKAKRVVDLCYKKKYPNLCQTILKRKDNYEKQMSYVRELEKQGRAFIIRPQTQAIKHFENDYNKLCEFYDMGYAEMKKRYEELVSFMNDAR